MTMQSFLLVLVFLSVVGLIFGIGLWLSRSKALDRRLDQIGGGETAGGQAGGAWHARIVRLTAPVAKLSMPDEGWEKSNFRVRLMHAGLRDANWPVLFFGGKTLFALGWPGLYLLYVSLANVSVSAKATVALPLLLAALGYYLPNVVLGMAIRRRQREVREALPDAIDLMTVCVEAGLGLDAAMNRAGEEMAMRSQALSDELSLMALELRVGASRESALQNLALRTGVEDVATFVTILLQSEHFGTNVGDSLRVLSDTMRERRKQRAEEAAAKIPLKLLFPLIFFIFPSLFVVLMGPAAINIYRILLPTMGGGR